MDLENINKEITEIETNIKNAKNKDDLENALRDKDEALNRLEDLYGQNLSSITGNLIVDELKKESREKSQSVILQRADSLFNQITRGRYELRVEENGEPVFKAFDTVLNQGLHLQELSTGTRIQLLLSVRLAFVETQEQSLRLPILADELLSNSDDSRAKAIIDALITISREGRQVFYFTAQADEVYKWEKHLNQNPAISYRIFELTGENQENLSLTSEGYDSSTFSFQAGHIPSPEGKTHAAYGEELEVPVFNLLTQPVSQLHLWYLVENPVLLYRSLKQGIRSDRRYG